MQRSPILAHKHPTLLPPIFYLLSPHPYHSFMFLAVLLYLLFSLAPLTRFRFFNGMPEVFEPGALNYNTLSRFILWILSVFRNPILTRPSLSKSLDTLLCNLIALTTCLAFFLPMTRTLVVAISFLSSRANPSQNFLPPLSL